jgi:hypothetical protein
MREETSTVNSSHKFIITSSRIIITVKGPSRRIAHFSQVKEVSLARKDAS